ncbi:hypothetical protein Taro_021773 [Colocasia esculenta]|uniref:Uncharacterized protein n=1 Tax=Colocasia esculenta TaxID=4460 RepID=A0A843V3D8_COLES|nr:hypothetical protein [Colocasia esculenta]
MEWKVTPHDLHETQFHVNTRKDWYTTYHHKSLPTQGTCTYCHKVPARKPQVNQCRNKAHHSKLNHICGESTLTNHNQNCATTSAHHKPQPQSQLCQHQGTPRTGQTSTMSHKLTNHSQWQSTRYRYLLPQGTSTETTSKSLP